MPIGLQVQACWRDGEWVIASRSFNYINTVVIGEISVWDAFTELLAAKNLSV